MYKCYNVQLSTTCIYLSLCSLVQNTGAKRSDPPLICWNVERALVGFHLDVVLIKVQHSLMSEFGVACLPLIELGVGWGEVRRFVGERAYRVRIDREGGFPVVIIGGGFRPVHCFPITCPSNLTITFNELTQNQNYIDNEKKTKLNLM